MNEKREERGANQSRRRFFTRLIFNLAEGVDTFCDKGLAEPEFHWTWNNHLIFGFHKNSSGAIDTDTFFCKVGSVGRKINTAFKEAQMAAHLILNESRKTGQEVFLCVSGGIDSEAMLRAFMTVEKQSFHAVIMRFNNNLNDFDIGNVIRFCKANRISHEIFDVNILDFFESGKYLEYGKLYQCQSPQLAAHLYLLDYIKGCPVLSWQPPEVSFTYKENSRMFNFGLPGHLHGALLRYFVKRKKFGVPFFFAYTPELMASFFHLPLLQRMIYFGRKGAEVEYSYRIKCLSYRDSGFPVKPRKSSWTGFEKVRKHYDILDKKQYGTAFNKKYRVPLEKINPLPKSFYQIVPRDTLLNFQQVQKLEEVYGKL